MTPETAVPAFITALWNAMPRDVQRKTSLHDLKRIADNLTGVLVCAAPAPAAPSGEAPLRTWTLEGTSMGIRIIYHAPHGNTGAGEKVRVIEWPEGFTPPQPPVAQPTASAREWQVFCVKTPAGTPIMHTLAFTEEEAKRLAIASDSTWEQAAEADYKVKAYPINPPPASEVPAGGEAKPRDLNREVDRAIRDKALWANKNYPGGIHAHLKSLCGEDGPKGAWPGQEEAPEPPPAVRYFKPSDDIGPMWRFMGLKCEFRQFRYEGFQWTDGDATPDQLIASGWIECTSTGEPLPQLPELRSEEAAFDAWLKRGEAHGDVEEVRRQWEDSSDFADWLEETKEAVPLETAPGNP